MRSIANSLAVLLVLLMVSAPASAAACDLTCWLGSTLFDCHGAMPSSPGHDRSMSMSADMDMSGMNMDVGSQGGESSMGTSRFANAKTSHVMIRVEMVADSVQQAAEPSSDSMNPSDRLSSCPHDACSQMAISALWLSTHHFQPNVLHWIAIDFSLPAGLLPTFYPARLGTPPDSPPADRLVTTLRI